MDVNNDVLQISFFGVNLNDEGVIILRGASFDTCGFPFLKYILKGLKNLMLAKDILKRFLIGGISGNPILFLIFRRKLA